MKSAPTSQPARFLVVGLGGYLANVGAFAALYARGVSYLLASVFSYLFSNALMYLGNRYFTFRLGHAGFWRMYFKYLLVGVFVVALAAGILAILVEWVRLDPRLGQAISLLVVMPVAFLLYKRWSFQLTR